MEAIASGWSGWDFLAHRWWLRWLCLVWMGVKR